MSWHKNQNSKCRGSSSILQKTLEEDVSTVVCLAAEGVEVGSSKKFSSKGINSSGVGQSLFRQEGAKLRRVPTKREIEIVSLSLNVEVFPSLSSLLLFNWSRKPCCSETNGLIIRSFFQANDSGD